MTEQPDAPVLRIVSGHPDDAELAALVTVLVAASGADSQPPATSGAWSDLSLRLRTSLPPGPNAWRDSRWL